jgi:hypothetical protein
VFLIGGIVWLWPDWYTIAGAMVLMMLAAGRCVERGCRSTVATLGLADLMMVPILSSGIIWLPGHVYRVHVSADLGALLTVYVLALVLIVSLLLRRPLPDWLFPLSGVWARRLQAVLGLGMLAGTIFWEAILNIATLPHPDRTPSWFVIGLMVGPIYLWPVWDVLTRGWGSDPGTSGP